MSERDDSRVKPPDPLPDGSLREVAAVFLRPGCTAFGGLSALQLLERGETEAVLAALGSDYEGIGY